MAAFAAAAALTVTSLAGACTNSSGTPGETPTPAPTTTGPESAPATDPSASTSESADSTSPPDPGPTSGVTELPTLPPGGSGDPNDEVPHDPPPRTP
jgi:hypothetical protein